MSVFRKVANVREARLRMSVARQALQPPAVAWLVRGHRYPLTTVGSAAEAGFVLASLNVHPLRVPGVSSLLGGGLADAVAYGIRLMADLGMTGVLRDEAAVAEAPDARACSETA